MPTSATKTQTSRFDCTATWALFSDDIRIFPVNPFTKKPLLKDWPDLATDQHEQIDIWSRQSPHAMVGVLCGRDTDLFVLDLDKRERTDGKEPLDGHVELAMLEKKWGPLPPGPRSQTPGGGVHIPFRYPSGVRIRNGVSQVAPGIDVRSDRGFVIYPGSVRSDGRAYDWLEGISFDGRPYAPDWLIFLVLFNKKKRKRLANLGINSHEDFRSDNPALWNDEVRELMRPKARKPADYVLTDRRKKKIINYVESGIEGELNEVRAATEGVRDSTLNTAAISIWSLLLGAEEQGVDIGELEADVFSHLVEEALGMGEEFDEDCVRDKWDRCRDDADPRNLWHVGTPDAKEENEDIFERIGAGTARKGYELTCLRDVKSKAIEWLWYDRIPLGKVGILAGPAKRGKSQLTCALAAAVTTGGVWPDGTRAPKGSVIFIGCEDDAADTIRPRIEAAGGDVSKFHIYEWTVVPEGKGSIKKLHFDVQHHSDNLEQAIEAVADVALIIIDPISAYMGKADSHKTAEVRAALQPIQVLARRHKIAVTMISHLNKNEGMRSAMDRVSGSGAFIAVARWAYMVDFDPEDETTNKRQRRRYMAPLGANNSNDSEGFFFYVESATTADNILTQKVVFDGGPVEMDADELIKPRKALSPAIQGAMDFLEPQLMDGEKRAAADLIEKAAGQRISSASLRRAAEKIRVKRWKDPQENGVWWWQLKQEPLDGAETPDI